ncbi:MAG: hypothetical protein K0S27_449 [Gammaproteobacteria bacterium]|jgi:hypothetical protein|nr:hypothetical protein [Gammaproteobacteria bacterium]
MKTPLLISIVCLSLLVGRYSWSCSCGSDSSGCQQNVCVTPQDYCQCADINSRRNPCISKSDYCRDFGNVGDNKFSDSYDNQ